MHMNWLNTILVLGAAFLAVFWEAAFGLVRDLLGAQIDLLPPLIVYASLCAGFETLCLLALGGGLLFDSLSANPLGISVLPLILIGVGLYSKRELIVRDQAFAQLLLGLGASALAPTLTLLLLLTTGRAPLFGWGTLWQLTVMALGGAIATPVTFIFFEWLQRALVYRSATELSFRPDREIRRGRG
jgi:rod shape-determining protein MreD